MAIEQKFDLPALFGDEAKRYRELAELGNQRSSTGDVTFTSATSGTTYNTAVGTGVPSEDANIVNKGQDGLFFWLGLDSVLGTYNVDKNAWDSISENIPNRNYIINGNFDIWQRGNSQTTSGYGSDDRWSNSNSGTTKTHSRVTFTAGQTDVPNNPSYFSRTVVSSVVGASNFCIKTQAIEDVTKLSGQTVTLSFWAKADASKNIAVEFVQSFGTGGSPFVTAIGSQKIAITTSWQKYSRTFNIPSVSGKTIGANSFTNLTFWFDAGSTFNTRSDSLGQQSGTFDIAQVKVETGSTITPFIPKSLGEELIDCQRYYEKSYDFGTAPGTATANGSISELLTRNIAAYTHGSRFKVSKRDIPTVTIYSTATGAANQITNNGDKAVAAVISIGTEGYQLINITSGDAGATASHHYVAEIELN